MLRRFFFIVTLGSLIAITAMAQNPYRLYSFFSFDVAPANATSYFTTDQSFSFPLISNLSLVVAGEWKSPLSETFFTNPPRFGLRGGAVYVFPDTGIYIDGLIGWIRHNKQDPLSQNNFATDSIFYELGFNWENSYLYVGVRERLLTSPHSITSISHLLIQWYPLEYWTVLLGGSLGIENDVPLTPGIRGEIIVPLVKEPLLFRVGPGIIFERFHDEEAPIVEGQELILQGSFLIKFPRWPEFKITLGSHHGDRNKDVLTLQLLITSLF
jgi:hypothetical protein